MRPAENKSINDTTRHNGLRTFVDESLALGGHVAVGLALLLDLADGGAGVKLQAKLRTAGHLECYIHFRHFVRWAAGKVRVNILPCPVSHL